MITSARRRTTVTRLPFSIDVQTASSVVAHYPPARLPAHPPAERSRRAVVTTAEGEKASAILRAEGLKQSAIVTAEGAALSTASRLSGRRPANRFSLHRRSCRSDRLPLPRLNPRLREVGNHSVFVDRRFTRPPHYPTAASFDRRSTPLFMPFEATAAMASIGAIKELWGLPGV